MGKAVSISRTFIFGNTYITKKPTIHYSCRVRGSFDLVLRGADARLLTAADSNLEQAFFFIYISLIAFPSLRGRDGV
jgi:hypothetical protein